MYICIDLKSFYASAECAERNLDPLNTHLVVADPSKTEKTICLAVSPSLKAYGVPGRPRLFEVVQRVKEVNEERLEKAPYHEFVDESFLASEVSSNDSFKLDYIVAPPRMALYEKISSQIYGIYLKYIAPEDILVYSIDEVFIDASAYLGTYQMTAHELAMTMIRDVLKETHITATAGIGTNMFLAKVAMDILAKKMPPDEDGVRIAELDEDSYRDTLWDHMPITDFWRVGKGISNKLAEHGMFTMSDVAAVSETNEDLLYELLGINAKLLIDHAWGYEPCKISDVMSYIPNSHSISQGQVLSFAYKYDKAELVIREMADLLVLDLVKKNLVTDQLVLTVGYDHEGIPSDYNGKLVKDQYGRYIPQQSRGSLNLEGFTSSTRKITEATSRLFKRIVNEKLMVRRMYIVANHVIPEGSVQEKEEFVQFDLFSNPEEMENKQKADREASLKERTIQNTLLNIKERFGKNAVVKGMNLHEGATAIQRNQQIGGHRA